MSATGTCRTPWKITYDERVARTVAEQLGLRDAVRMHAYPCEPCGGWHVARTRPRPRRVCRAVPSAEGPGTLVL
jgi:hypothetical protein